MILFSLVCHFMLLFFYAGLGHYHYAKEIQGTGLFVGISSDSGLFNIYFISGMALVSDYLPTSLKFSTEACTCK